jgi:hypothetical protein
VVLSGIGFDFTAAISGTSSLAVAAGQTADYTITINPATGNQGTFSYSCGTLPTNAQCLFNPATTTVSAGATGNVTVEIATGKSGSANMENPAEPRMLPLFCGLMLLPLALRRCRKALPIVVLLAVIAGGISSCTGSGGGTIKETGGSGTSSATPPGTYSVQVTVSSTGVSHVVTVTMTVD